MIGQDCQRADSDRSPLLVLVLGARTRVGTVIQQQTLKGCQQGNVASSLLMQCDMVHIDIAELVKRAVIGAHRCTRSHAPGHRLSRARTLQASKRGHEAHLRRASGPLGR